MKKFASILSSVALAGLVGACGAVSNGGTTSPTPTSSASPSPTGTGAATTIHDIRTGLVPVNTSVTLPGLIVTAVDSFGDFYAQDVGGGQNSGTFFFDKNHHAPATIAIGDEITVTGTYTEYAGPASSPWTAPHTETEIVPDSVTQTNTGLTPTIDTIDSGSLASLNDTTGEPWEGCLVTIGGTAPTVSSVGMGYGEYAIKGAGTDQIRVNGSLFDSFETSLVGSTVTITGIVSDSFKHYHLNPRSSADITFGTPATMKTYANVAALFADTTLVSGTLVTITAAEHISAVHAYTNTAATKSAKTFWAQDGLTGAVKTGLFFEDPFYRNPTIAASNTVAGVQGKYIVYGSTSQAHSIQTGFLDLTPVPAGVVDALPR